MGKYELNARGLACPLPVIKTKKLLEEYSEVLVRVDNYTATENLEKLAKQLGYSSEVEKKSEEEYLVTIVKEKNYIIDTLKDTCVVPVTQAKRAILKNKKVDIIVKLEKHVGDLKKLSEKEDLVFSFEEIEDYYKVTLERKEDIVVEDSAAEKDDSYIVVINKKIMGHGSEELGKRLIKGYLAALSEQAVLPKKMIFYNDGATLVNEGSHVLEELKELENRGVEIVCCGACINYHNIKLAVGNPTNMYFIAEDMRTATRILQP